MYVLYLAMGTNISFIIATWTEEPTLSQQQAAVFSHMPGSCAGYVHSDGYLDPVCSEEVDWKLCSMDWEIIKLPDPDQFL